MSQPHASSLRGAQPDVVGPTNLDDLEPRRVRQEHEEPEIDMAPMIDTVFLLLIFFMVTASFVKQKTQAAPGAQGEGAASKRTLDDYKEENIIAELDAKGVLRIDGAPVEWGRLRQMLEETRRNRRTSKMVIRADDHTAWDYLVYLQDEAALAGIEKILYAKSASPPSSD